MRKILMILSLILLLAGSVSASSIKIINPVENKIYDYWYGIPIFIEANEKVNANYELYGQGVDYPFSENATGTLKLYSVSRSSLGNKYYYIGRYYSISGETMKWNLKVKTTNQLNQTSENSRIFYTSICFSTGWGCQSYNNDNLTKKEYQPE